MAGWLENNILQLQRESHKNSPFNEAALIVLTEWADEEEYKATEQ